MLLSLDKPTNWRTKLLGVGLSSRFCKAAWQIAHGARIGGEISILPSWACMAISWWRKAFSREILILATGIGRQQTAELFGAGAVLSFFLSFFLSFILLVSLFVCLFVWLAGWLSVCPCMSVGRFIWRFATVCPLECIYVSDSFPSHVSTPPSCFSPSLRPCISLCCYYIIQFIHSNLL